MRYINGNTFTKGTAKTIAGLIPVPLISGVIGGNVGTFVIGHTVIINGFNFHPNSVVEISSGTVNSTTYVNPTQLSITISTQGDEGLHDVLVKNGTLDSGTSGDNLLQVTVNPFIDLRTASIASLGLTMTSGITVSQDPFRGLVAGGTGGFWDRGVLFTNYQWNRFDNVNFSVVFTRSGGGTMMIGVGGSNIDVENLGNQSYYSGEIALFHNNTQTSIFFGGGQQASWSQAIGTNVEFNVGKFYKVTFMNSGTNGAQITIHEVLESNFETNISLLHQFISNTPATDTVLMPFWVAPAFATVFISGFKVF